MKRTFSEAIKEAPKNDITLPGLRIERQYLSVYEIPGMSEFTLVGKWWMLRHPVTKNYEIIYLIAYKKDTGYFRIRDTEDKRYWLNGEYMFSECVSKQTWVIQKPNSKYVIEEELINLVDWKIVNPFSSLLDTPKDNLAISSKCPKYNNPALRPFKDLSTNWCRVCGLFPINRIFLF